MEEGQELLEEGWQAHDLRSGVAKVYAEAKRRSTLGIRVCAIWAVMVLVYGCLDMAGVAAVAPPWWDFIAGAGVILLSALSISRAPVPLLAAAAVVLVDLVIVAYRIPELFDRGESGDYLATAIRVVVAPVAVSMVINGYFGSLSIQAFKLGFSPGADWRTRINPAMMQLLVVASCAGALMLGVATWFGAIRAGFAQTNVLWSTKEMLTDPIPVQTARPKVAPADTDGKTQKPFLDIILLRPGENDAKDNKEPVYPDTAKPITSLDGYDAFGKRAVTEAFEFGADTNEPGCVLEGQGRQDRCRDDRCKYWARIFVRACLVKAKKVEHYCDDVPDPMQEDAGTLWAQRTCAGRNFDPCREILWGVQGHCHPPADVAANPAAAKGGSTNPSETKGESTKPPETKAAKRASAKTGAAKAAPNAPPSK